MITYLKHDEINQSKWDACIESDPLQLPYGFSWYLDASTDSKWDALVFGDYEAVLPLPWNRKLGLKQVYQPHTCQQLGVFGEKGFADRDAFLKAVPRSFVRFHQLLNSRHAQGRPFQLIRERKNVVLPLSDSYQDIKRGFSKGRRHDLSKAQPELTIKEIDVDTFLSFYESIQEKLVSSSSFDHSSFQRLSQTAFARGKTIVIGAFQDENLCAASLFIHATKRIVNLMSVSNDLGKSKGGATAILDHIIRNYSGSETILDFEGSSIDGVRKFFLSFGGQEEIYFEVKR